MTQTQSARPAAHILKLIIDPSLGVPAAAAALDAALRRARVLHVTGGGTDDSFLEFWAAVNESIGRIDYRGENPMTLERVHAIWNDIRYDPLLASTYRHSKTAQPLHTDGAYNQTPPSIGFFFCQAQARAGGRTLFLDADVLCDTLREEEAALFAQLRSVPVRFGKGIAPGQTVPIIDWDEWGPVVNWNRYRVMPGQGPEVTRMCETFFAWLDKRFVQTGDLAALHLRAGDCMVFHDLRCVHGREAYVAELAGERCLWNLNLHWDGQAVLSEDAAA